jgi:hypothetical protein
MAGGAVHCIWDKLIPSQDLQVTLHAGTQERVSSSRWAAMTAMQWFVLQSLRGRVRSVNKPRGMQSYARGCEAMLRVYGVQGLVHSMPVCFGRFEWLTVSTWMVFSG